MDAMEQEAMKFLGGMAEGSYLPVVLSLGVTAKVARYSPTHTGRPPLATHISLSVPAAILRYMPTHC